MTLLLAHPEAEDLGRFVEGTLDESERAAIVDHIADCDDCRILVVDAAEFAEPEKVESHSNWWMGVAASLMLVAAIGGLTYRQLRDPLADAKKDSAKVKDGPLQVRLSGFAYPPLNVTRGGVEDDTDPALMLLQSDASKLTELDGNDPKTLHARGIGLLLSGNAAKESIAPLEAAASREPNNAKYQNDLAAAFIAVGNAQSALAACDRALRIDTNSPDALFNRAVALQALDRPEALAAYDRYLAVDATSPWADKARRNRDLLQPLP